MRIAVGGPQLGRSRRPVRVAVMAVRRRQSRVLFPVDIAVPVPVSLLISIPLSVTLSVFALGLGAVSLLPCAVIDNVDIAIFRGRHAGSCQGSAARLEDGKLQLRLPETARRNVDARRIGAQAGSREMLVDFVIL